MKQFPPPAAPAAAIWRLASAPNRWSDCPAEDRSPPECWSADYSVRAQPPPIIAPWRPAVSLCTTLLLKLLFPCDIAHGNDRSRQVLLSASKKLAGGRPAWFARFHRCAALRIPPIETLFVLATTSMVQRDQFRRNCPVSRKTFFPSKSSHGHPNKSCTRELTNV